LRAKRLPRQNEKANAAAQPDISTQPFACAQERKCQGDKLAFRQALRILSVSTRLGLKSRHALRF
jgi:hypothetical protein